MVEDGYRPVEPAASPQAAKDSKNKDWLDK